MLVNKVPHAERPTCPCLWSYALTHAAQESAVWLLHAWPHVVWLLTHPGFSAALKGKGKLYFSAELGQLMSSNGNIELRWSMALVAPRHVPTV